MYSYFFKSGKSDLDGVEILKYKICLPAFEGKKRMSEFYFEIAEQVLVFCEKELKDYALSEYEKRGMPKRDPAYPKIMYNLNGRVTYFDGEHLFVLIEATLKRRGERAQICRRYDAHGWSLSDELLMSPKEIGRIMIPKGELPKEARRAEGLFISDGRLFCCNKDIVKEIVIPEKSGAVS